MWTVQKTASWRGLYRYARAAVRFVMYDGPLVRSVRTACRFVTNGSYRSTRILRWRKPKNLFQPNNDTWPDRYPFLFRLTRKKLGDGPDLRLLSFGCSTGEEVFSLRKHFPSAWIKGIDINPHNISICAQRLAERPDPKICFELTDSVEGEPLAAYDAIFCMAVFRHGDLADARFSRCDSLIRFADFCQMVEDTAGRLKPGGLLLILHANFRFRDTPTAAEFELAYRMKRAGLGNARTPLFDRDNRRTNEFCCDEVMFRKRPTKAATD